MTDHPHDPGAEDTPPHRPGRPLDPTEARRRHHARRRPTRGEELLRAMTRMERRWMEAMVRGVAADHRVDADELLQDLQLGLLCDDVVDAGRSGLRRWLRQRATWKAKDLRRKDQLGRRRGESLDDLVEDPPAVARTVVADPSASRDALERLGLNRDESQIVLLHLWGLDVPMQEFAALVDHTYAKARKDLSRGLRKIIDLFDLEPDEYAAYVARRDCMSVAAAASRLGWTELRTERLVRRAEHKIARILQRLRDPDDLRDEVDPDAL